MNGKSERDRKTVLLLGAASIILVLSLILVTISFLNLKTSIDESSNQIRELEHMLNDVKTENHRLKDLLNSSIDQIQQLKEENANLKLNLENLTEILNETIQERDSILKKLLLLEELNRSGHRDWIYISAIHNGKGEMLVMEGEIRNGSGRLLADVDRALIGTDFQKSMRTALAVAEKVTGNSLDNRDIVIRIKSEREVIVDGESAGASLAVLMIALIEGEKLNKSVVVTGRLTETGKIVDVSGVEQKTIASKKVAGVMLVPSGQKVYVPGIEVVEVDTIQDVLRYYFNT